MRRIIPFLLVFVALSAHSQIKRSNTAFFAPHKFAYGVWSGVNFSAPKPQKSYSVFTSLGGIVDGEKIYQPLFQNTDFNAGFMLEFKPTPQLGISLMPAFANSRYAYQTNYLWSSENGELMKTYKQIYGIKMFEIPAMVRIYFFNKRVQPFIGGGFGYAYTRGAWLQTETSTTDSSVGNVALEKQVEGADISGAFIPWHNFWMGNAGISINLGGTLLRVEAVYKSSIQLINNEEYRYNDIKQLSKNYDIPDDLKNTQLSFNLGVIIPMVCEARALAR